ncbi:MAG: hypothetical protein R3C27_15200 [Hyphomonadaceae bacterium]
MRRSPDAFAALAFLSAQSADVDPRRIGINASFGGGLHADRDRA